MEQWNNGTIVAEKNRKVHFRNYEQLFIYFKNAYKNHIGKCGSLVLLFQRGLKTA